MRNFIVGLLFAAAVTPACGIYSCQADSGLDEDGIPVVPPPTPVEPVTPSTGTVTSSTGTATATTMPECIRYEIIEVRYACGVEEKCNPVKVMDSLTRYHYTTVCTKVPKYCTRTEKPCAEYKAQ